MDMNNMMLRAINIFCSKHDIVMTQDQAWELAKAMASLQKQKQTPPMTLQNILSYLMDFEEAVVKGSINKSKRDLDYLDGVIEQAQSTKRFLLLNL